jgi:hypothetical protein
MLTLLFAHRFAGNIADPNFITGSNRAGVVVRNSRQWPDRAFARAGEPIGKGLAFQADGNDFPGKRLRRSFAAFSATTCRSSSATLAPGA